MVATRSPLQTRTPTLFIGWPVWAVDAIATMAHIDTRTCKKQVLPRRIEYCLTWGMALTRASAWFERTGG